MAKDISASHVVGYDTYAFVDMPMDQQATKDNEKRFMLLCIPA